MMGAQSGNQGYVIAGGSTIAELHAWNGDWDYGLQTHNPKSGGGSQKVVKGNEKFSGTIEGAFDPADPIETYTDTGAALTLRLHHTATKYKYFEAFIGKVTYGANLNTGEIQTFSASFESHGPINFV